MVAVKLDKKFKKGGFFMRLGKTEENAELEKLFDLNDLEECDEEDVENTENSCFNSNLFSRCDYKIAVRVKPEYVELFKEIETAGRVLLGIDGYGYCQPENMLFSCIDIENKQFDYEQFMAVLHIEYGISHQDIVDSINTIDMPWELRNRFNMTVNSFGEIKKNSFKEIFDIVLEINFYRYCIDMLFRDNSAILTIEIKEDDDITLQRVGCLLGTFCQPVISVRNSKEKEVDFIIESGKYNERLIITENGEDKVIELVDLTKQYKIAMQVEFKEQFNKTFDILFALNKSVQKKKTIADGDKINDIMQIIAFDYDYTKHFLKSVLYSLSKSNIYSLHYVEKAEILEEFDNKEISDLVNNRCEGEDRCLLDFNGDIEIVSEELDGKHWIIEFNITKCNIDLLLRDIRKMLENTSYLRCSINDEVVFCELN